jgi:GR25 family glycosyltransferase involved in LPS biosynthesis
LPPGVNISVDVRCDSMKAYVINMPRSPSRRASVAKQLVDTQLDFEFVDGIDGNTLTPSERGHLVSDDAVAQSPHWLTPGVIGCALSHLRAYEQMTGDINLVLEDDVVLPATINDLCARVAAQMHGREVVLLHFRSFVACRFSARDAVDVGGGARLMYPIAAHQPISASGYLVTSAASQSLAEAILPVRVAPDSWGHLYALGALDSVRVLPRPIGVRNDIESTIGYVRGGALRRRVGTTIARGPGLKGMLTLNRLRTEKRMSRTAIVPEQSPIARAHSPSSS